MRRATRVRLVPPEAWDEPRLVDAARTIALTAAPLRPGDAVGGLVVVAVEPESGASPHGDTQVEILPAPPRGGAPAVDVIVLLDVSESMGLPWDADHTRLEAARRSVEAFLRAPGSAVAEVTLIEFAKEARVVAGPAAPGAIVLPASPAPRGRCATARALDAALAHAAARLSPDRAHAILLLTDGVSDVAEMRAGAERAGRLRTPIHSVVFAPERDEAFADVSRASGGSDQRATYPLTIEFEHQPGGA